MSEKRIQRRLAAMAMADVVGYSRRRESTPEELRFLEQPTDW